MRMACHGGVGQYQRSGIGSWLPQRLGGELKQRLLLIGMVATWHLDRISQGRYLSKYLHE